MGNSKGTNTLRFTDEEFKELLYNTYNGKVISLDKYITAKEKIRFKDLEYNEI